jgi:aspartyl-tRNA(Asn)/glutamyl-tRNA(Gln) amidotransferase subunit B
LPAAKKQRFKIDYQLDEDSAATLTASRDLADFYEAVVKQSGCEARLCSNWVTGDLLAALNKANLDISAAPITHERFAGLLMRIMDNTISGKIAKQVFDEMWQSDATADQIISAKGLQQITDSGAIAAIIDKIIDENPSQVEQYRSGKDKVFGFFVGQAMKQTQGKANPEEVNKLLKAKLEG